MKKVALITGGTRGIGLGISRALAAEGYDLALNGLREVTEVQEVLDALAGTGSEVIYCRGNLADQKDRSSIFKQVVDHFGRVNLLVNNAGMAPRERKDVLDTDEESFREVLDVNLHGPFFLTQQVAKQMVKEKLSNPDFNACIVNISSVSATLASVNRGEYCISKAGMSMMSQLFAVRLGEYDIPVFEIRPGVIRTDMTAGVSEKYDQLIAEGLTLQRRWGISEDVGRAVASLARGELAYSTGQVIQVDGGMTMGRL